VCVYVCVSVSVYVSECLCVYINLRVSDTLFISSIMSGHGNTDLPFEL